MPSSGGNKKDISENHWEISLFPEGLEKASLFQREKIKEKGKGKEGRGRKEEKEGGYLLRPGSLLGERSPASLSNSSSLRFGERGCFWSHRCPPLIYKACFDVIQLAASLLSQGGLSVAASPLST